MGRPPASRAVGARHGADSCGPRPLEKRDAQGRGAIDRSSCLTSAPWAACFFRWRMGRAVGGVRTSPRGESVFRRGTARAEASPEKKDRWDFVLPNTWNGMRATPAMGRRVAVNTLALVQSAGTRRVLVLRGSDRWQRHGGTRQTGRQAAQARGDTRVACVRACMCEVRLGIQGGFVLLEG